MSPPRSGQSDSMPTGRLEDKLLQERLITPEQYKQISAESRTENKSFIQILLQHRLLDEITLKKALSSFYQVKFIEPVDIHFTEEGLALLPADFMNRHQVIPFRVDPKNRRAEVLMMEPDQLQVLDEIALLTGYRVTPCMTQPAHLIKLLSGFSQYKITADDAMARAKQDMENSDDEFATASEHIEKEMATDDAPIVQLVNAILADAIIKNASDVHLESVKEGLIVRFRIDGILRDIKSVPKNLASAVISRIKVSGGMDISEKRRPQDGRIKFRQANHEVDMRVNTLAVQYGESVVIRLLKPGNTSTGLENLGLEPSEVKRLMRMIQSPNGIVLVTGPTGSGKTTSLYACLREINSRERKIITIEDPIEYPLPGINQTQISHKAGLDFSVSLRAIMRQDPDVIMVGEIRDKETLEAAMHASLTGHLVFSTLHTNSTAKTITRLREMGAPAYMISSTIVGIVAQRLIRRICDKCKTGYSASPEELRILGFQSTTQPITLYKGVGCDNCEQTGYKGRVGLYEIMDVSRDLQELIDAEASIYQLQDTAIQKGMITLGMDGERKIAAGLTTVDEVTRVLGLGW